METSDEVEDETTRQGVSHTHMFICADLNQKTKQSLSLLLRDGILHTLRVFIDCTSQLYGVSNDTHGAYFEKFVCYNKNFAHCSTCAGRTGVSRQPEQRQVRGILS